MTRTEKLLAELIALPSVNPTFLPPRHPHAGEQRVADFLAVTAAQAGLEVDFQRVLPGRSNVIARLRPENEIKRTILLAPHLDTVGAEDSPSAPPRRQCGPARSPPGPRGRVQPRRPRPPPFRECHAGGILRSLLPVLSPWRWRPGAGWRATPQTAPVASAPPRRRVPCARARANPRHAVHTPPLRRP